MYNVLFSSIERDVDVGINHFSFHLQKGQPFGGIKGIVSGSREVDLIHFISEGSLRYGYWITPGLKYYCVYNSDAELYEIHIDSNCAGYEEKLRRYESQSMLVQYPRLDENDTWYSLTSEIRWYNVSKLFSLTTDDKIAYMDSSMTTIEEAKILQDRLQQTVGHSDHDNKTLRYAYINFKSREAIRDTHKMEDFYDKSHYLFDVVLPQQFRDSMSAYMGELQMSFINAMFFASYGSSMQWHNLLQLLCDSNRFEQYKRLDEVVSVQINNIPEEYFDTLINRECWTKLLKAHHSQLPNTYNSMQTRFPELIPATAGHNDCDCDSDPGTGPVPDPMLGSDSEIEMNATSDEEDTPTVVSQVHHRHI